MAKDFEGKVVWITGASSGIGEALAIAISGMNARLILSARRENELNRVKENCREGAEVRVLKLDLAEASSLQAKVEEVESLFGQIDILINNGGISQRDGVIDTSMEVQRDVMEANYFGAIALTTYTLPAMVKRRSGQQVVISSAMGILSVPKRSAYAASKHALHGWYDALRAEHHDDNLKVTLICPGYVSTQISYNAIKGDGTMNKSVDDVHKNGMPTHIFAKKAIKAILGEKQEVHIGGFLENLGVYTKRFFPTLYSIMVRKVTTG